MPASRRPWSHASTRIADQSVPRTSINATVSLPGTDRVAHGASGLTFSKSSGSSLRPLKGCDGSEGRPDFHIEQAGFDLFVACKRWVELNSNNLLVISAFDSIGEGHSLVTSDQLSPTKRESLVYLGID